VAGTCGGPWHSREAEAAAASSGHHWNLFNLALEQSMMVKRGTHLGLKSYSLSTFLISSLSSVVRVYKRTSFLLLEESQAFRGRPPAPAGLMAG